MTGWPAQFLITTFLCKLPQALLLFKLPVYILLLRLLVVTVFLPCASAAQGACSNPSPSKDLKQNKSQTAVEITAVVKGRCSQNSRMLQPFPLAYLCFCLHHVWSSLCHKPVQKALIYFSMAHFVKNTCSNEGF